MPWHKIGIKHFEEWEKKAFPKARRGDYEKLSDEEQARLWRMMEGVSLRK